MTTACNIRSGTESAPSAIGRITLDAKPAGERRTGDPYAPFDRAGAGNGRLAYRASPRPYSYELESARDEIELEFVEGIYWEPATSATNPLAGYVDFFFAKKQQTPKNNPRREMYKLLLNALYGKLIQLVEKEEPMLADHWVQAGSLFHPFWASMITGHCRARLHTLEHEYQALHASTDSILTRESTIVTGAGLGDLEIKAQGTLLVLRPRLYVICGADGRVLKDARHGFHGSTDDLLGLILRGGGPYSVRHMIRPREALRAHEKPFRMVRKRYELHGIPPEVWTVTSTCLGRLRARGGRE